MALSRRTYSRMADGGLAHAHTALHPPVPCHRLCGASPHERPQAFQAQRGLTSLQPCDGSPQPLHCL